jgi:predicted Zn finger-like uncharacterized protein
MAIEFDCPHCTTTIRVPDGASGKKGKCPQCQRVLQVPTIEIPPTAASASASASTAPAASPAPPAENPDSAATRPTWLKEKPPAVPRPPDDPSGFVEADIDAPPDFSAFGGADEDLGEPLIRTASAPPPPPATPELPPGAFPALGAGGSASSSTVAATGRRTRRKQGRLPAWVIPIVGVALFAGFFVWFNWSSRPTLSGPLPATAYGWLELPPQPLDATTARLAPDRFRELFAALEGSPIESQLMRVDFRVEGSTVETRVLAGSDTRFVKVAKRADPNLVEFARQARDELRNPRFAEMQASIRDYDRWFTKHDGGALEPGLQLRLRNDVALNTLAGPLGSHLEAIYANQAFRCVFEDTEALYFLLPKAAKTFEIIGRRVADAEPVFYGEYVVTIEQVEPGEPPEDWVDPWEPTEDRPEEESDPQP